MNHGAGTTRVSKGAAGWCRGAVATTAMWELWGTCCGFSSMGAEYYRQLCLLLLLNWWRLFYFGCVCINNVQNSAYLSYAVYRNLYTRVCLWIPPCLFLYIKTYFVLLSKTSADAKGAGFELEQYSHKVQGCWFVVGVFGSHGSGGFSSHLGRYEKAAPCSSNM